MVLKWKQLKPNNSLAAKAQAIILNVHTPKDVFSALDSGHQLMYHIKSEDKTYSFNIKSKIPIS